MLNEPKRTQEQWDAAWRHSREAGGGYRSLAQKRFVWPFESFIVATARLVRAGELSLDRSRVLDFGCGHARHAMFFAQSGFRHVSAIDVSPEAVREASAWAASEGAAIDFRSYDGEKLPYRAGSFDLVTCFATFQHVPAAAQRALAADLARVVRKGGHLVWAEMGSRTTKRQAGRYVAKRSLIIEDPGDPEDGLVQHYLSQAEYRALFPGFDFQVGALEILEGEGLSEVVSYFTFVGKKVAR